MHNTRIFTVRIARPKAESKTFFSKLRDLSLKTLLRCYLILSTNESFSSCISSSTLIHIKGTRQLSSVEIRMDFNLFSLKFEPKSSLPPIYIHIDIHTHTYIYLYIYMILQRWVFCLFGRGTTNRHIKHSYF